MQKDNIAVGMDAKTESVSEKYSGVAVMPNKSAWNVRLALVNKWDSITNTLHRYGLWFLIAILLGAFGGVKGANWYLHKRVDEIIQVRGFLWDKTVYQVLPRP